ncbi:predicted protein [Aspergillus terreus NIH2624]|uniref:Uncharacterized protein n=1 Tax=Aspergillus terreus (strain NIH 2624 / FGSC A1156) TaxID=341663 RepID=Q0CCX1_ASPTN|nr:uncharacterized protein ATEG_08463 [Aspergillus terreus NIH2624]EAU31636.1 predicted protein [Aspergillus terreus NIH2624]
MADMLFERIPRLQVMICRQCRYGVWRRGGATSQATSPARPPDRPLMPPRPGDLPLSRRQHEVHAEALAGGPPVVLVLRARPGPQSQQAAREAELQRSDEVVSYQQLFPSRAGSHYIHIRFPHGRALLPPPPDQAQQAVDAVVEAWEQAEAASR